MQVGFYQFDPQFGEVTKNLDVVTAKLEQANTDLIVLPELFVTGLAVLHPQSGGYPKVTNYYPGSWWEWSRDFACPAEKDLHALQKILGFHAASKPS
ncbi:MAG: hypothetical protein P0119_18250 [Nitrospira sp.]|nr:hypothetical protein [Nitrospira sp.]